MRIDGIPAHPLCVGCRQVTLLTPEQIFQEIFPSFRQNKNNKNSNAIPIYEQEGLQNLNQQFILSKPYCM